MPRRDGGMTSYNVQNARDAGARANPAGGFKRAPRVSDSIDRVGSSTAMCSRNGTQARPCRSSQSREERITCPPGRLIQVFTPLRAKRRRRRPNRSPMSRPSIPTENLPTASQSSMSIRNRHRIPRLSATWRRPRAATSFTILAGTPARHGCARMRRTPMWSDATSWHRACAPRASKFSPPNPTPRRRKTGKPSRRRGCGPRRGTAAGAPVRAGIYVAALGNKDGKAPGGVFVMDHESFEPLGRWEVDRGSQQLGYDAWWHLGYDTMVTSEWGTPDTFENGLVPEILLGSKYG